MEDQKKTSFTFEIDNFSEKEDMIQSPKFLSGGCEWYVQVYPKGDVEGEDHLSLYLCVANHKSLSLGWKRRATFSFVLLNQSGKELNIINEECSLFFTQALGWGLAEAVPLKKLQEKGFLEENKLIVKVEVKVIEVVVESVVTGKETLDVNGFQVLYSQVYSVSRLFMKHPDIAVNLRAKSQLVKATYITLLLGLIETLNKPPHSLSETELSNSRSELMDLTDEGFKLDWLKTKLDEVTLERKKTKAECSRVHELEEHIKNLKIELNMEKANSAAKCSSLEQTVSNLKDKLNKKKTPKAFSFKDVFSFWNIKSKIGNGSVHEKLLVSEQHKY